MALIYEEPNLIDAEAFSTVVQLQLEDVENLASRAKGKQREDTVTDEQLALQIFIEDLHTFNESLRDRGAAQKLASAATRASTANVGVCDRDKQISQDRELARRLARPRPQMAGDVSSKSVRPPGTSTTTTAHSATTPLPSDRCIACAEDKDITIRIPCADAHTYCHACITALFRLAVRDAAAFPPRCHGQQIPLSAVRFLLPPDLIQEYELKTLELRTQQRTYCHDPTCGAFIPAHALDDGCVRCGKVTCAACSRAAHGGAECPADDEALEQLKAMAEREQWQRCYACHSFVQLERGCNHVLCRCGAQFCYACGTPWKGCECVLWEESRLYDPSEATRRRRSSLPRAAAALDNTIIRRDFAPLRLLPLQDDERRRGVVFDGDHSGSVRPALPPRRIPQAANAQRNSKAAAQAEPQAERQQARHATTRQSYNARQQQPTSSSSSLSPVQQQEDEEANRCILM